MKKLEKSRIFALSRVVPIEKAFTFSSKKPLEEFCAAVKPLIEKIKKGESFSVIVERRSLKGAFSSQEIAKEIGTFISKVLEKRYGEKPKVSLGDPDKAVIFETRTLVRCLYNIKRNEEEVLLFETSIGMLLEDFKWL